MPRITFQNDVSRLAYALLQRFNAVDGTQLPPVVVMISVGAAVGGAYCTVYIGVTEGNNGVAHLVCHSVK